MSAASRNGLSPAALERVRLAIAPGGSVARVRPLRGGISSSVHQVTLEAESGARQAVVVRRLGAYWQRTDPAACEREFKSLLVLEKLSFPAPRPLLLDVEGGPFGAPTVVMTRLPGRPLLAACNLDDYLQQMAHTLARLHALPIDGLEFLPDQQTLVERTLGSPRPTADDPLQQAVRDAAESEWPRASETAFRRSLIHGDYWPGNLLWRRGRLVGVVDWEQSRLGDPASDVATARGDLSVLFGPEAAEHFVVAYKNASGITLENLSFWDLLISIWAVRDIEHWATVYPILGRAELTPDIARERIRAFANAALANTGMIRRD